MTRLAGEMRGDPRVYRALAEECIVAVHPHYRIVWPDENPDYLSNEFTWPGTGTLYVSDTDESEAIHDVAHVIVCPPERRCLPEFGLGPDPANHSSYAERVVSANEANEEEHITSVLHVALACYVGGLRDAKRISDYLNVTSLSDVASDIDPYLHCLPADFWDVVAPTLKALDKTLRAP